MRRLRRLPTADMSSTDAITGPGGIDWREVIDRASALGSRVSGDGRADFETLARELGAAATTRSLLTELLRDERFLARVAEQSFHHTNHFDKIVFLADGDAGAMRLALNLWRPPFTTSEVADEQIHDHRCEFWSTILFGTLRSEEFERNTGGETYEEVRYRAAASLSGAKRNEYRPIGPVGLRRTRHVVHRAGTTYHLARRQIHRIVISDEPTATLLLRGPYETEKTSLFTTEEPCEDVELPALGLERLRDDIEFVLARIA